MEKTLEINVCDEVRVDDGIVTEKKRAESDCPILIFDEFILEDRLLTGVESFSRPPPKSNVKIVERAFCALPSVFIEGSLKTKYGKDR